MIAITEAVSSTVETIAAVPGSASFFMTALAIVGVGCLVWGLDRLRRPL